MALSRRASTISNVDGLHAWQARRIAAWGRLIVALLIVAMLGVLGRVVQLKLGPDPRMAEAVGTAISSRPELGRRGDLLDRRGRVIASSTVGYRLFVDPKEVEDIATIAVDLAAIIGGDPVEMDRLIQPRLHSRYVAVKQLLQPWQVEAIERAELRGVGLEPRLVRHYPYGDAAAALVGKVGFEHTGLSGMEHRFNERMLPEGGHLTYLRDARRHTLWIEPDGYVPGRDGRRVRLSIDLVIQQIVEEHVRAAVKRQNAGGGRMVVLDCRTGELLALFDILNPRAGWDEQTDDPARAIDPALGRNRCVTDPYEPGSTFKPFVWSLATELGKADLEEVLPTPAGPPGHRTGTGRLIRDAYYYGPSTWRRVLVKSMNAGMAIVAERMNHRQLRDVLRRFGFGEETGCGLPGESPGIVTTAKDWTSYTQCSVAMGHEIAVTPVQMVRAFSAFARDGTIPTPRLTAVSARDGEYRLIRRAVPESIALLTRDVMREVMIEGTGRHAQSEHYRLFGKSGTAQLPKKEGGGYHEDRYVSSFIAGAPLERPRIVVLCVIDDPDRAKGHYGGAIAGPVVRDVIDATLNYLGVPPDQGREEEARLVAAR
ncbi:MAG: penicillin-binding protein 2 [Planctomycetota bacterium]|nr:penicillin-binding protein 2 [Planctomycetota bacterium]